MRSPYELLARAITKRPFAVLGVVAAVFMLALFGLSMVSMETGDDTYIDKDTPRGALLAHYKDTYGSDAIMLIFECNDVTNPDVLAYIAEIEDDIRNEQYINSVSGITDLMKRANGGILPTSSAEVSAIKSGVPAEMLERYLPSSMMTISVITLDPGTESNVQKQVLDSIRTIVSVSEPPASLSVTLSGTPAFAQEMEEEIGSSMSILILAAMLLMLIVVGTLFSHVRYHLLPVVIVGGGVILTFGVMGLLGIPVSMTVVGAFPVLIGIGIDYAIQIHARFDEEMQHGTIPDAVKATVTKCGWAVLIAMLATVCGFIAMFFAPIPMIADFGITCVIGVTCCYLAALVIVPLFGVITKYKVKEKKGKLDDVKACELNWKGCETEPAHKEGSFGSLIERYNHALSRVALAIAKNPVPILLILGLVAVVGYEMDAEVPINADENTFVPSDMPALLDMEKVTRTMGSTTSIPVVVTGDNVLSADTLRWIDGFTAYEQERNDKMTGATSIVTLIKQYNNGVLPDTEGGVKEVLSQVPEDSRDRYLNGNMETVIEFSTVDMTVETARTMIQNLIKEAAWYPAPPGIEVKVTGGTDMFAAVMDDIDRSKTMMVIAGFILILAFLLLVYRRVNAITPLIPIVMVVGWNGAIMYLLGLDYTPMTATLGSMSIGVASEYTILIMERFEEELARGLDLYDAIQTAVQKIGMAITVSGLATVSGFSALTLSAFNIISNFGLVTVISVGFSLLGAILVMPAVLAVMYRFTHHQAAQDTPAAPQA